MPFPQTKDPALNAWGAQIEERLRQIETPQGPTLVWGCTAAALPSAATYVGRVARVTDLKVLAVSDGANWIRQDTGAAI